MRIFVSTVKKPRTVIGLLLIIGAAAVGLIWRTRILADGRFRVMQIRSLMFSALVFAGCDVNSYVPTADFLRSAPNPTRAFVISEESIHGIYGNMDVDSEIYQYTTTEANADRFWEAVGRRAAEAQWKLVHDDGIRHYERIVPAVGTQACHSAEQVRIGYDAVTRIVTIAWVQADVTARGVNPPTAFPTTNHAEGEFASRVIWPKFEQLIGKSQ